MCIVTRVRFIERRATLWLAIGCLVAAASAPVAAARTSPNYASPTETLDAGGRSSASTSYGHAGSIGGIMGSATSASYQVQAGYPALMADAVPDIQVEAPLGNVLVSGVAGFDFGIQPVEGGLIMGVTHRIKNTGTSPLTGLVLTITGDAAADFTTSALPPTTLAPGETFQFIVRWDPTAPGERVATLSLVSNDPDENPFTVPLHGVGLTAQEAWRMQYFLTLGNTGNAADDADPDGDGQTNLFEFVAGLVPNNPASRFQLRIEPVIGEPGQKAVVFGPVLVGRTYVVKSKGSLSDPTWEPLTSFTTSDAGNERTVIDLGAGSGARFYEVEITRP